MVTLLCALLFAWVAWAIWGIVEWIWFPQPKENRRKTSEDLVERLRRQAEEKQLDEDRQRRRQLAEHRRVFDELRQQPAKAAEEWLRHLHELHEKGVVPDQEYERLVDMALDAGLFGKKEVS